MKLLDVNILIYAHREDTNQHAAIKDWLDQTLLGEEGCAVSELVLSSCMRIITHRRIFNPPTPLPIALELVQQFHDHPNIMVISPGKKHWNIFRRLCREGDAKGNLISDAYHAALAIEYGCEWITTDRDFARFPDLKWKSPLMK